MGGWYIRDRGRVMGPFSTDQLLDMRDRGQIQSYHEVSPDRRSWKALDLVPELGETPYTGPRRGARTPSSEPAPPPSPHSPDDGRRKYALVVGGVLALVLVGGLAVGGVLLLRSRPVDKTSSTSDAGAAPQTETQTESQKVDGAIAFGTRTPTKERDKILAESVGLVIAGVSIKWRDGSWLEAPEFGSGSGFAVTPEGHVLTNRHVVEELVNFRGSQLQRDAERKKDVTIEPKVWVFFGRENKFEAEIVHVSADYDLAVLKLRRTPPRYFALCRTDDPHIPMLDAVSSLGFPGSDRKAAQILNPSTKVEVTKGAAIQRTFQDPDFQLTKENGGIKKNSLKARPDAKFREAYYLAHTARIAPGNSGGPLITPAGIVLGINTLGIQIQIGGIKINQEGQNFALTMPQLRKEVDKFAPGVVWRDLPE